MTTSALQREPAICNTTPVRHFALAGAFDVLVATLGGRVAVPRLVLDPDEDTEVAPAALLSEIGQSERFWVARAEGAEGLENWSRLHFLRQRADIAVIDLDDRELETFAVVSGHHFAREQGLGGRLGQGEAAVISVVEHRGWAAVLDDAAGRSALLARVPSAVIHTSRDVVRAAAAAGVLPRDEAEELYFDMTARGYRGPDSLWA